MRRVYHVNEESLTLAAEREEDPFKIEYGCGRNIGGDTRLEQHYGRLAYDAISFYYIGSPSSSD